MSMNHRQSAARKAKDYAGQFQYSDGTGRPLDSDMNRALQTMTINAYCAGYMAGRGDALRKVKRKEKP